MKAIFCCAVFCLLFSVSARRDLHQTTTSFTSTSGTAVATASSSSSTTSTSSSSSSASTSDGSQEEDAPRDPNEEIDVYFLVDLTVKVPGSLDALQQSSRDIVEQIFGISSNVRIGVGTYVDEESDISFRRIVDLTEDQEDVIDAFTGLEFLSVSVGRESQFFALEAVATEDGETGFRNESLKIIIWIGDSPALDPIAGSTEVSVTEAITELGAYVFAIDTGTLDVTREASRIIAATDGLLLTANEEGLFETVAVTVTSDDNDSQASASASGDSTFVSSSAGGNTAAVFGPLSLPDAIIEGVLTIVEADS